MLIDCPEILDAKKTVLLYADVPVIHPKKCVCLCVCVCHRHPVFVSAF